jgi:hypothetical protein
MTPDVTPETPEITPEYPEIGSIIPAAFLGPYVAPGAEYRVGECGHRVAAQEWRAGLRNCERCGG